MSETLSDQEVQELMGRRRDPRELLDSAREAADVITAPAEPAEEEEPEALTLPPPAQDPVTAVNRAAAVQRAREATEPPEGQDFEPEAEADVEPAVELPPPAPEDWLTEEPDFDAEAREVVAAEALEPEEEFTYEDDPRLIEERTKRIAAEKKAAHFEAQRVKDARKTWVAEALEHAPLAADLLGDNLEEIKATSKRAFLREAAEAHQKARKVLERQLGSATQIAGEEVAAVKAEAKREAAKAYGRPTSGPGVAPAQAAETAARVAAAREQRGLRGAIREMIDSGMNP
jgi:hypothetical protein